MHLPSYSPMLHILFIHLRVFRHSGETVMGFAHSGFLVWRQAEIMYATGNSKTHRVISHALSIVRVMKFFFPCFPCSSVPHIFAGFEKASGEASGKMCFLNPWKTGQTNKVSLGAARQNHNVP